jgi:hypothetical protein
MTETKPYLPRNPGDPVTAEDWNELQTKVRSDIAAQVGAAKDDVRKTGVDRAGNADKFAGRSDTAWIQELDQHYAPKNHDHEGRSVYRRYIKDFTTDPGLDQVLLTHKLGRYPLVDVFELLPTTNGANGTAGCKLFFFYGHVDEETYGLSVRVGRDRVRLGVPFDQVLAELEVAYDEDSAIGDVVNDMWDALRKDPNDEVKHCTSPWIDSACGEARTVGELKRSQQWDDLRLALRPDKCVAMCGNGPPQGEGKAAVEVTQLDYDTLWLRATGLTAGTPLDLMILLRV